MPETQNVVIIRSVAIFGSAIVIAIVLLAIWGPVEGDRVERIFALLITVATVVVPALVGFKLIGEAKTVAAESVVASKENAAAIAIVADTADTIHEVVNSRDSELRKELALLRKEGEDQRAAIVRMEATISQERHTANAFAEAVRVPAPPVVTIDAPEPGTP